MKDPVQVVVEGSPSFNQPSLLWWQSKVNSRDGGPVSQQTVPL